MTANCGFRLCRFGVIAWLLILGGIGVVAMEEACEVCHCDDQKSMVNCSNRGLTDLPIGIPNDTAKLYLDWNFLREIPDDWLLQFHRLFSLNLSRNLISEPFRVPPSLKVLFANDNQLQDIRMMMTTGYQLEKVTFERNQMEVIRTDTFGNSTSITELSLDSNKISQIDPGGLALSEFAKISLNDNRVAELSPDMFGGRRFGNILINGNNLTQIKRHTLGFLKDIGDFSKNNLQKLQDGLFLDPTGLERKIQSIDLTNNHIRQVSSTLFRGLCQVWQMSFAANKLNDETLPNDLLVNLTINGWFDLSENKLTKVPGELLRTQHTLRYLYLQRNLITTLDETSFKGLHSLVSLFIYQNPIVQLADFQFYETSLRHIIMFQGNLTEVGKRPFATKGNSTKQILLYGNSIENIHDTVWQDLGPDCFVSIDKSLRQVPHISRKDIVVELVGDDFIHSFHVLYTSVDFLTSSGLVCEKVPYVYYLQCTPCRQGTYGLGSGCTPCPPGGFFQNKTGQYSENEKMNCQICNKGTYVSPEAHPGTRATDCKVCPTGTEKSTAAGFRACPCVDNYYRTDRFGECHQCPLEGINCSGEYQHLRPGYWWTWNWASQENHDSYLDFVTNIRIESDSYDRSTQRFGGKLPRVHKCPRNDTCPNGGIGIDYTCSEGYKGWMCSECASKYYSWLGHCLECPEWPVFAVEVFCILVFVCIVVGVFVWDAYKRHRRNERNIVSVFLARGKIVVGFCQVMGEIFSALDDIPWPTTLQTLGSFFKTLEVSLVGWLISPRCFIRDFIYPNIYIEFLFGSSFIIAVIVVAFSYYGFKKCYLTTAQGLPAQNCRDDLSKSKRRCFLIVVILLFLSYPSVCNVIITLLPTGCKLFYLDEDREVNVTLLRYDYAIDCEDPGHSVFNYAAQTSLSYVVGFPLALFLLLWSSKERLSHGKDGAPVSNQELDQVSPDRPTSLGRIDDTEAPVSNQYLDQVLPDTSQDRVDETQSPVSSQESDQVSSLGSISQEGIYDTEAPVLSQDLDQESSDISQGRISEARIISWESFLCENYKAQFWYWEIIELTRKILQTLFLLLFGPEDHFTLFASVVLSVFFLLIHAYLKPMKDAAEQRLQMCSLVTIFLNMLAASLLLMPNDAGPLGEYNKGVLAITLVLLNLSIIAFVALSVVGAIIKALYRYVVKMHTVNQSNFECFAFMNKSVDQMYRQCRRRYRGQQDGYLDDECNSSQVDNEEQDDQTNVDEDLTPLV